jgi:hypothetical protein
MEKNSPYLPPTAQLKSTAEVRLPIAVYILGFLAAIFSIWYLGFDGRKWFLPLNDMNTFEIMREWVTRAFYGLPKLGVIIGLISLFKFKKYSFSIYRLCWFLAIGHTIMYYGTYSMGEFNYVEMLRVAVHHLIPHTFYIVMLLMLFWHQKATNNSLNQIGAKDAPPG